MNTAKTLRIPTAILAALLSSFVALTGPAVTADANPQLPAAAALPPVIMYDNWPRSVKAGTTVKLTVGFTNPSKSPRKVRFRANMWCFIDSAPGGRLEYPTAWKTYTIPGGSTKAPLKIKRKVTIKVKVPKRCSPPSPFAIQLGMHTGGGLLEWHLAPSGTPMGMAQNFYHYAPYTKSYYRYNLAARSAKPSAEGSYQAHHTMPQKYAPRFSKVGLNIHNPKYLRWWCSTKGVKTNHQANAKKYNDLWAAFFAKNASPSKAKILAFRKAIQGKFKYSC